jgi:2-formylbenzoate dehydrogenase
VSSIIEGDPRVDWIRSHNWTGSAAQTYDTVDPATGAALAAVPDATVDEIDQTVRRGLAAFHEWRLVPVRARAAMLRQLAGILRENAEELAALDALDSGNPIRSTRNDVEWAAQLIEATCDFAGSLTGQTIPASADHLHFTLRQPYGVVARIIPFNHPLFFTAAKIAAPLLAGNATVVKAPDQTPLSPLRAAELLEPALPDGLVSVVTGVGPAAGAALVAHPLVERIAFIGGTATGRAIQRAAADAGVKTVTLELGGKNPLIAFADADLDRVCEGAVAGMNFNTQGQSCGSTSRLIAHESIAADLVDRVAAHVREIRLGHPLDELTTMGPLVSSNHRDRVLEYIHVGSTEGARLVTGGQAPAEPGGGFYVEPTIFDRVDGSMRIAREEIFGPVLSVLTFSTEAEALKLANATDYGLTASIYTNDLERALALAGSVDAGYVWLNGSSRHYWGVPFGGWKASGVGTEEALDEVLSFTRTKSVHAPVRRVT